MFCSKRIHAFCRVACSLADSLDAPCRMVADFNLQPLKIFPGKLIPVAVTILHHY